MATRRESILGAGTVPDNSGNVFFEPYSIKATNGNWPGLVAIFNDSGTRIGLHGRFKIPAAYVGTAKIIVSWTSTATSGDTEWDFDYRAVAIGESLDQATPQESVNQEDTAPGSTDLFGEAALVLTSGNFAAGDIVEFTIWRDGTDGGDTMAAAAILFDLEFEYADA